jgi:hypothetical protein
LILAGRWRADLGICSWVEGVLCLPAGEGEWDRCAEKFECAAVYRGRGGEFVDMPAGEGDGIAGEVTEVCD